MPILCAAYVGGGVSYLLHLAELTGMSGEVTADSDVSGFFWRVRVLNYGGIFAFIALWGLYKRAGHPVSEMLFLLIVGVIVLTNVVCTYWITGIFAGF